MKSPKNKEAIKISKVESLVSIELGIAIKFISKTCKSCEIKEKDIQSS